MLYSGHKILRISTVHLHHFAASELLQKFSTFYGTKKYITMFTTTCHLPPLLTKLIQSTPFHPISLRSILILFSHPCEGLKSSPFPPGFPVKFPYAFFLSPICAICPVHLTVLDFINLVISGKKNINPYPANMENMVSS